MRTTNERQAAELELSEHELSEIRMLIEERTGICFDQSRERFFVTRVREHLQARGFERGNGRSVVVSVPPRHRSVSWARYSDRAAKIFLKN